MDATSDFIASLKLHKQRRPLHSRKGRVLSKFDVEKIDSALSTRAISHSLSRKRAYRKVLHKIIGGKSSKKLTSSKIQSKMSQIINVEVSDKIANGDTKIKNVRNRRKKLKKKQTELDDVSRLQRRAKYLMIKLKLEQNLIDAYSGEGWKGQSREKIRPEKELVRATNEILKCKLGIRDSILQLDSLSSVGCIEDSVIAPDGSIHHEHIFCTKCKLNEAFPDNDIVLCDGTCNCAFHQKCLDPPLQTDSIPPEDEGWFCRFCECKMEIIDAMNAHLGTHFPVNSKGQEIFKDEAVLPDGGSVPFNLEEDWPSDDSEDDDYHPERRGKSHSMDPAGPDDDDTSSSTSLSWSSQNDCTLHSGHVSLDDQTSDGEVIWNRRRRKAVDYKKLYDEMFGRDVPVHEQLSEDEDWGPARKKHREKESDAATTLMTLCESEQNCKIDDENKQVKQKLHHNPKNKKSFFRIPFNAVEKLRLAFADNELPSKTTRENLAEQLDLEHDKVNKWFKNARYLARKTRKGINDYSDDLTLKKFMGLNTKREEKKKKKAGDNRFEAEMERVCKAKLRLDGMKQRLLILRNLNAKKSSKRSLVEESVMYVPIVQLREK